MNSMKFRIIKKDPESFARSGEMTTRRGTIQTPVFMPVATRAAVRAQSILDLEELDFDILLSNTYHLYLRPGLGVLERAGGLHRFMNYSKPILTDSGGFQVFSLGDLCRVHDHGVEFRSHIDGSLNFFSPEKVLDIQKTIGSDIMMVLDHCVEYPVPEKKARIAAKRTMQWAADSIAYWNAGFDRETQSLFAIVQGSTFRQIRRECSEKLVSMDFPGYAVGGLSVGEPKEIFMEMAEFILPFLPDDRPRYMMGVGSPLEILHAVSCGADMFDSVMPTRIARNGTLFTSKGRINIKSAKYEYDFQPLDAECTCYVCKNFTRSYLRHIFRMNEIAALIYNTHHNLFFMKSFFKAMRLSIENGNFRDFYGKWRNYYGVDKESKGD